MLLAQLFLSGEHQGLRAAAVGQRPDTRLGIDPDGPFGSGGVAAGVVHAHRQVWISGAC
ncbi:hypothetical protein [Streptomyces sp. S186]|uniref:hypothetical protein n=1 Tax=Streptomyces sp. S186 TaxID=3434395 RepID=UPI003F66911B